MWAVLSEVGRSRLAAAGVALFAGGAALLAVPAPARADAVYIEVNPSTILAGYAVYLRASCGSTANPAHATSEAFGTVTLTAEDHLLTATATVPSGTSPHGYTVRLTCATGGTANTTLWVISATAEPTKGPDTGGGYLANHGGPGGTAMIAGGLAAVGAGGVLALWAARRRRAGEP